mmetsp:Transcript_40899/g.103010  ORF Transcript_40899/g.103010 Transcript_40899/m.103010 type:complete len:179 (+) Transcript_40899:116-652(+)
MADPSKSPPTGSSTAGERESKVKHLSANPGTTSTGAPVLRHAKALFAYRGTYEDELTFNEGDLLDILSFESIEEGWYRARLASGKVGLVPGNYLSLLEDDVEVTGKQRPRTLPPGSSSSIGDEKGTAAAVLTVAGSLDDNRDTPLLGGGPPPTKKKRRKRPPNCNDVVQQSCSKCIIC